MDDHTTMFESIKQNSLDFLATNETSSHGCWLEVPNPSSSTPFDFSSSYLHYSDADMPHLDPNLCHSYFEDETAMIKPLDGHHEFFENLLIGAIQYLKERFTTNTDVLVQLWSPVVRNGKRVLTTDTKPFIVNSNSTNLSNYRQVSKSYQFVCGDGSIEKIGLPGHVFLKKFPICNPDFRFSGEEIDPRVSHAQTLNLCGCLIIPVFKIEGATCLGVIEIVTSSQKVNFRNELENICKALEAFDLRSSEFLIHPKLKGFSEPYQLALGEIRDALRSICHTLKLPLAQTWCPYEDRSQPLASISIIESASYVFDPKILGFFEACCEHRLAQGEGIAGKALGSNQPCFTADIADFCRAEYPLVHEARMFGLSGAVAVRLGSTYTGLLTDFILEFFFPRDCKSDQEQKQMLSSIASMIQSVSWSLNVIMEEEVAFSVKETDTRDGSWISHMLEAQKRGETVVVSMGCREDEPEEEFKVINEFYHGFSFSEPEKKTRTVLGKGRSSQKNRVKAERNISLKVLQQYFPGSLKDAAKSMGVCPTTLKRICRQHGIMRWPSRKIKKVGHSLKKLQLVIDSVQGAEGTIQLGSFYTNFPELSSPLSPSPTPKNDRITLLKAQTASNSSSSCTPGSSSSRLRDNGGGFRVKAAYGEEKVRFRMGRSWGFNDLQAEIGRHFSKHDMGGFRLEYLDDDLEWVLLTCDADLEECMDLHVSTENRTIRLFLHESLRPIMYPCSY